MELAPLLGLSDGIVDIVETGATLRENGLEVAEDLISHLRPAHRQQRQPEAAEKGDRRF